VQDLNEKNTVLALSMPRRKWDDTQSGASIE